MEKRKEKGMEERDNTEEKEGGWFEARERGRMGGKMRTTSGSMWRLTLE